MVATPETATIEREIGERIAGAKLRLRFDKVAQRLIGSLKTTLAGIVPDDQTVIVTVTAPIRLPAKTAAALEDAVRTLAPGGELRSVVHGNQVQVRHATGVPSHAPRVVVLVHNPASDARLIMDLAETGLRERT